MCRIFINVSALFSKESMLEKRAEISNYGKHCAYPGEAIVERLGSVFFSVRNRLEKMRGKV